MKITSPEHAPSVAAEFERDGYAIVPNLIDAREYGNLAARLESLSGATSGVGTRCLLASAWCQDLARSLKAAPNLAPYMPIDAVAV